MTRRQHVSAPRRAGIGLTALALCCAASCSSPPESRSVDRELERPYRTAVAALERGDLEHAAVLYRRLLRRARTTDDALAIGNAAYDLAFCLIRTENMRSAIPFLDEAQAALERAHTSIADVLLVRAKCAWALDEPEEARECIAALLAESGLEPAMLCEAHLLLGAIACEAGDLAGARTARREARDEAGGAPPAISSAGLLELEARIATAEQDHPGAASAWEGAAAHFQQASSYDRMASALTAAADASARAGDRERAVDLWYRAARCRLSTNAPEEALAILRRAIDTEDQPPDGRIQHLLDEILHLLQPTGATD